METNQIITIQKLLAGRDAEFDQADPKKEIKLIRHATGKTLQNYQTLGGSYPPNVSSWYELYIYERDFFEKILGEQEESKFKGIKYIVVFIGERGAAARFVGVYKVLGSVKSPYNDHDRLYDLQRVEAFAFLEERIVIDWGKSTVGWHQYYYNEKNVVRIDSGIGDVDGVPLFRSYNEVILSYDELNKIIKSDNEEWKSKLEAVNCIYLIQDKSNGKQYVGSTYGTKGIWGRWSVYSDTGHGNNKELMYLLEENENYHKQNFQWSILETLPINITQKEAISRECVWKRKMLTNIFGYTLN